MDEIIRAQRLKKCHLYDEVERDCNPTSGLPQCSGQCNQDGTYWQTIGTLRQPQDKVRKVVLFRKFKDWWPEKQPLDSKRGTPLYLIEPIE